MNNRFLTLTALAGTLAFATAAQANSTSVENALKNRPELSTFYNGLVSTGILNELSENQPYTIFAPTNEAFARLDQSKYPCFYAPQCKAQVAEILRRHIVPGEKHLSDMNPEGGVYSMFSIDNQHVVGAQPNKNQFTVDGQRILNENQLLGGDLYEVDGVLATDRDLVQFEAPIVVGTAAPLPHEPGTDLPPHVPAGKIVTIDTSDATKPIPY